MSKLLHAFQLSKEIHLVVNFEIVSEKISQIIFFLKNF
jgi:hypothetical protein